MSAKGWSDRDIMRGIVNASEAVARYTQDESRPSWVYFAAKGNGDIGDLVKIGVSRKPEQRMQTLKSKVGFLPRIIATVPGSYDVELSMHDAFVYTKHRGEWYVVDKHLRSFIDDCQNGRVTTMPPAGLPEFRHITQVEREVYEAQDDTGDLYFIDKVAGSRWYDVSYLPRFWNGRVNSTVFHVQRTDLHEKAMGAIQAHAERSQIRRHAMRPKGGR